MPTAYRFELAPNKRAGCQNKTCKSEGIKIEKGELRFGNWVEIADYPGSWKWKHWGCVTPLQITNLQTMLGSIDYDDDEALDALDGWDELDDESRTKIKQALKDGHIPDEDWKGDPELNRPGKRGITKATPKKSAKSKDARDEDEPAGPMVLKKKSRAKKVKDEDDVEADVDDAPKAKPAPKPRKSKVKAEPAVAAEDEKPQKSRKRKKGKKGKKVVVANTSKRVRATVKPQPVREEDPATADEDDAEAGDGYGDEAQLEAEVQEKEKNGRKTKARRTAKKA
ncbi:hypothetical protein DV735_g1900, partial [Chaetothyriales sp. CBS 134920]